MRMFSLSRIQRFGIAIIGVTLVAALRLALEPLLGSELPFFLFAFPVILAAWFGGLWPGLLATALSLLIGDYLFLTPMGEIFRDGDFTTLKRISIKGFFGVAFSLLAERLRDSIKREMDSMERSRLLIEGIKDYAILMLDSQGRVISWNSGAERITGYKENEILGKDNSIFFTPEKIEEGAPQRALELAAIEGRCEDEGWRVRKDGSRYWAIVITTALWDDAGRLRGFAKVTHDITQRKELEEERERLLRREKAAREEAEAASRMKDEFLETVSHELRTPMTSILGWARLLSSGAVSDHKAHHAIDVIAKNAQSQTQLIDDLIDTSRIATGEFQFKARPVEIERVFLGAIDDVRPSAKAKWVTLSVVIDAQGEVVFGDANRLRQAILNLLSNAIKFSNQGGRVDARLARAGTKIEITVSDSGVGIEPQFLPHVFELFRQANSGRTRRHGGLGLGLAITRHIAEIHGGDISVSSPGKGQGATFKISLPLASAECSTSLQNRADHAA
jgi:PAS domain S-box-containing protein